jgi:hypothetical protein
VLGIGVRSVLAAVLLCAAALKLRRPRAAQAALATFGLRGARVRWTGWGMLVAIEVALAVGVAIGSALAAYGAAGVLVAFGLAIAVALARGRSGAPCGCFGADSRVSGLAIGRNVVLAACFAAAPSLPHGLSAEGWLALGLVVALAGLAALTVAVLALARELGALRLQLGPQSALEIPHEGPELGSRTRLISRFERRANAQLALAVFTSDGCRLCRALEPALAVVARDPRVALSVFDEERDADAWNALDVPGSPFAVALGLDGTVLAKGTFNNFAQLESVLATAERRERDALSA